MRDELSNDYEEQDDMFNNFPVNNHIFENGDFVPDNNEDHSLNKEDKKDEPIM